MNKIEFTAALASWNNRGPQLLVQVSSIHSGQFTQPVIYATRANNRVRIFLSCERFNEAESSKGRFDEPSVFEGEFRDAVAFINQTYSGADLFDKDSNDLPVPTIPAKPLPLGILMPVFGVTNRWEGDILIAFVGDEQWRVADPKPRFIPSEDVERELQVCRGGRKWLTFAPLKDAVARANVSPGLQAAILQALGVMVRSY